MGERGSASPLCWDQNLALIAGAGSGKTHSLVTLGLQLLAGARPGAGPLAPSKLVIVTFTDKAAAELRARLRHRVEALSRKDGEEPELRLALARQGREAPGPLLWRQIADQLGTSSVLTFHSLCAEILRRAPAGTGRGAEFQVLDERDAQGLLREAAERLILEELQREQAAAAELCRELGYSGGEFTTGLVDHLCAIFEQSREQVSPAAIPISQPDACVGELDGAIQRLRGLVLEATAADRARGGRFSGLLAGCDRALSGLGRHNFLEPSRFPALRAAVESERNLARQRNGVGELLKELKGWVVPNGAGRPTLLDHYGGCLVPPLERGFRELLVKLEQRYRAELARRRATDFSELMLATRDLLRDSLAARAEVQAGLGALLVDECQDTNRLQAEIVNLLAERRDGAPRPLAVEELRQLSLPLEPRFLCVVGDPKQSIYDFRGADLSVFGRLVTKIEEEGGRSAFLKVNRRSTPSLLSFWNRTFARLMSPRLAKRDFEVDYRAENDDQTASRSQPTARAPVDWLVFEPAATAEDCRFQEARAIAQRIRQLLSPDAPAFVEDADGGMRKPRGGDFALLLRRFTFVEVYRQALSQLGVPHRVIRGRGFYCAPEVMDLASLLSLIATAEDSLALAAVLRSPSVAVSDASLFRLAAACGGRISLRQLHQLRSPREFGLPEAEAQRLERFLRLYPRLRAERDRLGIRSLLRVALDELGYRIAVAGTPFGEQALANIDKVLDLADGWDRAGRGDCAAFAERMRELADADPLEAQAESFEAGDPRAVQIMTIHQAKGLEFPIVVVADLGAQRNRNNNGRVIYERELGLAVKPWVGENAEVTRSPRFHRLATELARREDAEYLRLLYVAMTRARDHLILSGQNRRQGGTWRELLQQVLDSEPEIRSTVQQLAVGEVAAPAPPPSSAEPDPQAQAEVDQVLRRVRHPKSLRSESAVFPVTHLQDYVLCPRRYLYAHHLGLREFSMALEAAAEDEAQTGSGSGDYRHRGTLMHRLLELTELCWIGGSDAKLRAHLAELLWSQGVQPNGAEGREILASVHRFLRTPFAARLAAAGEGKVHRELAFMLRMGEDPKIYLKGQIDLLFEDESGGATVIDYKAGRRHPRGTDAYRFQLDCYALAARQFVKPGVRVQTGIAFLADRNPEPELREARQLDIAWFETELYRSAAALLQSTPRFDWSGLPAAQCASLGCGYQYRCHSHLPGL